MLCSQVLSLCSLANLQQQQQYPLKAVAYSHLEIFSTSQEFSKHDLITAIRVEAIYRMFIDCGRQEVRLDDHSSHIIVKNSKQVRSQRLCVCFRDNRSFSAAETLAKVKGEEFGWCQLLGNKAPLF